MTSTASPSSTKRVLWAATLGLVAVPAAAVVLVLMLGEKDPKPRRAEPTTTQPAAAAPSGDLDDDEPEVLPRRPVTAPQVDQPERPVPAAPSNAVASAKIEEARRVENTDPALARSLLRDALAADPQNLVALRSLSAKMLIDENNGEARRLAERCLSIAGSDPDCAKVSEYTTEDVPEVETFAQGAEQCVKNTPDNVMCLSGLVNYHLMRGNVSEAAVYAGRVSQTSPSSSVSQFVHGRVRAASGNYAGARDLFEQACKQGETQSCFRGQLLREEGF